MKFVVTLNGQIPGLVISRGHVRPVPAAAEASCRPPRADLQSEASGAPRSSASDGCVPEPA